MGDNPDTKKIPLPSGAPPNSQVVPKTLPGAVTANRPPQAPVGDPNDVNKESITESKPPPQGKPPPQPPKATSAQFSSSGNLDTRADGKSPLKPKEKQEKEEKSGGLHVTQLPAKGSLDNQPKTSSGTGGSSEHKPAPLSPPKPKHLGKGRVKAPPKPGGPNDDPEAPTMDEDGNVIESRRRGGASEIDPLTGVLRGTAPVIPDGPPPPIVRKEEDMEGRKAPEEAPPGAADFNDGFIDSEEEGQEGEAGEDQQYQDYDIEQVVPDGYEPGWNEEGGQMQEQQGHEDSLATFFPPPPNEFNEADDALTNYKPEVDDRIEEVKGRCKRGRLAVTLLTAKNVRRKEQVSSPTNLNPYIKIKVGKVRTPVVANSSVIKKAGGVVDFRRETLQLNLTDPQSLIVDYDIVLTLEVWDQGAWNEEMLGAGEFSILSFLDSPNTKFEFPVPLLYPGDTNSNMEIKVIGIFEEALVGIILSTLYEGRALQTGGAFDIITALNMGEKYVKKSSPAATDPKGNPWFKEEQLIMWASAANWIDDMTLSAFEDDGGSGQGQLVGENKFSLLPYMKKDPSKVSAEIFALFRQVGREMEQTGEMVMKVEFLLAGTLTVSVVEGKRLRRTSKTHGRQDPYVILRIDGQAVTISRKTKVDNDGGSDPIWNENLVFDIVDQYLLEIECWDQDIKGKDEMIGKASFSLLSVFKRGLIDTWIVVKRPGEEDSIEDSGDIHLILDFKGPKGVAYPQLQLQVDSYDERHRVNLPEGMRAEIAEEKRQKERPGTKKENRSYEYTDEEIQEAFNFIDIDKNGFLSSAELRHILVCMGELVTDEEIDAMVALVDADGDGQVSYGEFFKMIIHPEPHKYDCRAAEGQPIKEKDDESAQKAAMDRTEKKKYYEILQRDNGIGALEVKKIFERYRVLPLRLLEQGADFDLFCNVLNILPTGQYHKLFGLFDETGEGYVDMKAVLLGLFNFVEVTRDDKVVLIFHLFDEDRSGFLSEDEILEILKATHMQTEDGVSAKMGTLMKQVKSPDRTLTLEEFQVIVKKFPNIIFPPNIKPSADN